MNPEHELILSKIPMTSWLSAAEIVRASGLDINPHGLTNYALRRMTELGFIERQRGKPANGGNRQYVYRRLPVRREQIKCLSCQRPFHSDGKHNRICKSCKGSSVFGGCDGTN